MTVAALRARGCRGNQVDTQLQSDIYSVVMATDGRAGALGRLKASRDTQNKAPRNGPAALSHVKNDEYMNTFHRALLEDLDEISTEQAACDRATVPAKGTVVQTSQLQEYSSIYPPAVVDGWISGPVNETGVMLCLTLSGFNQVCRA